jgi:hypothetical protein
MCSMPEGPKSNAPAPRQDVDTVPGASPVLSAVGREVIGFSEVFPGYEY